MVTYWLSQEIKQEVLKAYIKRIDALMNLRGIPNVMRFEVDELPGMEELICLASLLGTHPSELLRLSCFPDPGATVVPPQPITVDPPQTPALPPKPEVETEDPVLSELEEWVLEADEPSPDDQSAKIPPTLEELMDLVVVATYEPGCWHWLSTSDRSSGFRPYFPKINGSRRVSAAAVFWEAVYGEPFPNGMEALRLCGGARCVRPDHVFPVLNEEHPLIAPFKGCDEVETLKLRIQAIRRLRLPKARTSRLIDMPRISEYLPAKPCWQKVDKKSSRLGCWLWVPRMTEPVPDGLLERAWSIQNKGKKLEPGFRVVNICMNQWCIRPAHTLAIPEERLPEARAFYPATAKSELKAIKKKLTDVEEASKESDESKE